MNIEEYIFSYLIHYQAISGKFTFSS